MSHNGSHTLFRYAESVSTENLNNVLDLAGHATSGDGSQDNPYEGDWQSVFDTATGAIKASVGRYNIDNELTLEPPNHLIGTGTGGKDDPDKPGVEFFATSDFPSGGTLLTLQQGTNPNTNKEMTVEGIHFNGIDRAGTLLHADSIRRVWIQKNWFRRALGTVVDLNSRICYFSRNEIEQNNDSSRGINDLLFSIDGGNNRTVFVYRNTVSANTGRIYIRPSSGNIGAINLVRNRMGPDAATQEALISIDGGANHDHHPIRIDRNEFVPPEDGFNNPVIYTNNNGAIAGPVWITDNDFWAEDPNTGNKSATKAIDWNDPVAHTLFVRDNDARNFQNNPWDLSGVAESNLVKRDNTGDSDLPDSAVDPPVVNFSGLATGGVEQLYTADINSSNQTDVEYQTTAGVGTTATAIYDFQTRNSARFASVLVAIRESTSDYVLERADVAAGGAVNATSLTSRGSVTAHTYGIDSGSLTLSMDSTTTVNVAARGRSIELPAP